tara:strand:+ start:1994 stop:2479 length:486 start_codon:yes stop_codon:yes gene_type:complete
MIYQHNEEDELQNDYDKARVYDTYKAWLTDNQLQSEGIQHTLDLFNWLEEEGEDARVEHFGIDPTDGDICRGCLQPTNPNHHAYERGHFVNRIPTDDDWYLCGHCGGFECDECDKNIYIDCEVRTEDGNNFHEECALKLIKKGHLDKEEIEWGLPEGDDEQ